MNQSPGESRTPHQLDGAAQSVVEVLEHLQERGGHASDAIARSFRNRRELTPAERGRAARSVYAVLRSKRLLDFALDGVGASLDESSRPLARWIARGILDREIRFSAARELLPGIDWRALPAAALSAGSIADPIERLAIMESLPDWLAKKLVDQLGLDDAIALSVALNRPAPLAIRANRILTDRESLATRLQERGFTVRATRLARDGLILEGDLDLFRLPEFREGWFEVQDEGSQLISELVVPPPGARVLDACSGAGGKTLHLGALLGGKGRIAAVGVGRGAARQLEELRRRADRARLHNIQVFLVEEDLPASLPAWLGKTDRVLVDAPCSGLGVLRRNPEARDRLTDEAIHRLARLQDSILDRFAPFVKPGGRLIYATCSILTEENDEVVSAFLDRHPEFVPMPAKEILGRERAEEIGDGRVLRVDPRRHDCDGFFAAVLRRLPS